MDSFIPLLTVSATSFSVATCTAADTVGALYQDHRFVARMKSPEPGRIMRALSDRRGSKIEMMSVFSQAAFKIALLAGGRKGQSQEIAHEANTANAAIVIDARFERKLGGSWV